MDLVSLEGRLASFKKNKWPHPKHWQVTPQTLSQAGFYSRPLLPDSPDNVACVYCRKNLDGWEATDEAWTEHVKHGATCPLVRVAEQDGREMTFVAGGWPHQGSIGPEAMAQAGFFYWPIQPIGQDDTAVCVQCGLSLDGWEPQDDPRHEHARRRPLCPFLQTGQVVQPAFAPLFLASLDTAMALKELKAKEEEMSSGKNVKETAEKQETADKENMPVNKRRGRASTIAKATAETPLKSSSTSTSTTTTGRRETFAKPATRSQARESLMQAPPPTANVMIAETPAKRTRRSTLKPIVKPQIDPKQLAGCTAEDLELTVAQYLEGMVERKLTEFDRQTHLAWDSL